MKGRSHSLMPASQNSTRQYLAALRAGGSAQPSALDCSTPSWAQELRQRSLETPAPASRDTDPNALPVLGQYRLLALVGRGGMGEVYRAEHLFMKRQVAVKVIAAHLLGDPDARAHFHREVQVCAQLSHPN